MIRLTEEPLSVASAMSSVTDPAAGGIALFAGTTRAESSAGRELLALEYEAYPEMATRQLNELAVEAATKFAAIRIVIWHRTGRVAVGEASVIIAVSTAHRAAAFDACEWLIDQLKAVATIWKREVWADGAKTWVHPD